MFKAASALLMASIMTATGATAVQARSPLKLEWKNLLPQSAASKNPLSVLTIDQQLEFDNINWARNPEPGETPEDRVDALKEGAKSTAILKKQGIDVYALYAKTQRWKKDAAKRNQTIVRKYNSKRISMAGYLLPLEFSDKGVREFLLVPYVGACIHVPPPPINQTVYVHTKKPVMVDDLYAPVWVTGRMKAKRLSKSLYLGDGKANVGAGYTVSGARIVGYKN